MSDPKPALKAIDGARSVPSPRIALSFVIHERKRLDVPVDVIIGIEASPTQSFNCEGRIWTFNRPNVGVEFSPEMRKRLFEFTRDIVGEMIEIHIRDRCVFRAVVREPLGSEHAFQLSANDLAEAQALAQELKTGWRPVRTVGTPKSG